MNTFLAEIQNCQNILQNNEEKNFIQIDIIWYQDSNQHLNFVLREPRCTGQERIQVAKNLVELGVMNTQINHELGNIFDSNNIVNKRMALSKIKSDYINRNKISNDISIDVLAAKRLSDSLCLNLRL